MSNVGSVDTHQKALSVNLDHQMFGSFAEIGAGQEVARWFLQVGGASGTVAKTISAYDKEVSDDLYGTGTRYVSRPRLLSMLEREWSQLLSQLKGTRGATTRFFSFVDTISARNFAGNNECHGWLGLRFQIRPDCAASDVILHVNLRDDSNLAQQAAIGILGVNLIYSVCHHLSSAEEFLAQVAADLPLQRIEFDCVEFKGPAFAAWNPRIVNAVLVANNHAEAVIFPVGGKLVPSSEVLYKKAVVIAPGTFGAVGAPQGQMIAASLASLPKIMLKESHGSLGLFGLSCDSAVPGQSTLTPTRIVEQIDELNKLGSGVLLFRERELYKMTAFVKRFTKARLHFAAGLPALIRALQDSYKGLDGALLEGISRLFRENVRLSVFPVTASAWKDLEVAAPDSGWKWKEVNGFVGAYDMEPPEPLCHLYRYLIGSEFIQPREILPTNK